jgi:hypothetical protein
VKHSVDQLAPGTFPTERLWEARLAICRAVHGLGKNPGPLWRVGSNAPCATSEADSFAVEEPCPFCGAPGAEILGGSIGGVGGEYCPSCGNDWIVGDYDWRNLRNCLRFRLDLAAGLVQQA